MGPILWHCISPGPGPIPHKSVSHYVGSMRLPQQSRSVVNRGVTEAHVKISLSCLFKNSNDFESGKVSCTRTINLTVFVYCLKMVSMQCYSVVYT